MSRWKVRSFHLSLSHPVDVVGVRRLHTRRAQVARDLSAMIRRVDRDVGQNFFHGVGPGLTLGVGVRNALGESLMVLGQILGPLARQLSQVISTPINAKIRPHGESGRPMSQSSEPE